MNFVLINLALACQANGLDERNQTLKNMIVKYVISTKELWDEHLDTCVFAYNTSHHEPSLHTPFETMFGRKAVISIELTYLDPGSQLLSNYMKSSESVVPVNVIVLCIFYAKLYLVYILIYVITILFFQIDYVGGLNKHRQEILERVERKHINCAEKAKNCIWPEACQSMQISGWCKYA